MADRFIRFHVDLFVFDAGTDPLDEYVVTPGPLVAHRQSHATTQHCLGGTSIP